MPFKVSRASTNAQILACHPVMSQLRPHLGKADFVATIGRMAKEGYRMVFLTDAEEVRAVLGYRIVETLRTGKMLMVDDLVSADGARSLGYGKALFDWAMREARSADCTVMELDSAVHRADAHRFYFRQKMHVLGFHFSVALPPANP